MFAADIYTFALPWQALLDRWRGEDMTARLRRFEERRDGERMR